MRSTGPSARFRLILAEIALRALRLETGKDAPEGEVYVSSISAWEVAMLVDRGRLTLSMDVGAWIALSESLPALRFVPVDNAIAVRSLSLPDYRNRDPADRIIIATAFTLGKTIITKDRKIRGYTRVKSAW